jgi:hypothetical protein
MIMRQSLLFYSGRARRRRPRATCVGRARRRVRFRRGPTRIGQMPPGFSIATPTRALLRRA